MFWVWPGSCMKKEFTNEFSPGTYYKKGLAYNGSVPWLMYEKN